MESSVRRVFVFAFAIGTHWEIRHRCLWAVIRNVFDDGEARSAVGAVDEGVKITAVDWVKEFAQTVRTDGDIRRDGLEGAFNCFRVENVKGTESACRAEGCGESVYAGKCWGFVT